MNSPGKRPGSVPATPVDAQASAPRAAIYLRVSTGRQAEQDLSIPDLKAQTRRIIRTNSFVPPKPWAGSGASR